MSPPPDPIQVSSTAELNAAIEQIDQASPGTYEIDLTGAVAGTGTIDAIALKSNVELTINGSGFSLHGGGDLAVLSGNVTIENLTLVDTTAQGGQGQNASHQNACIAGKFLVRGRERASCIFLPHVLQ
jgi:hypothetical protein